ncbi:MAG: type II toxin-antitoxin system VapC family toxin [Candidatus Dadabacteria bacterium]|nr:type II toxin-antitoxin system VapC family toxin [Candidatus Dadabacteria bacterium]
MLKYMLDTNIVIYVINRRPVEVLDTFNRYASRMCISSITLAELLHGVEKSSKPEHNRRQVEEFVSLLEVLEYGPEAAAHYGEIRTDLEHQGISIGVNDLHIAGHARSQGLTLVTNNLSEFERVRGLSVDNWIEST